MGNVDSAPLVGLIGPAGAGKDTIAGHLVEHHGFHRVGFADRLARFCERIDPVFAALVAAHGGYEPAKRAHPYIRSRMIEVGDSAREIIGIDVWIDPVEAELEELTEDRPVVISDVRYRAEVEWLTEMGGTLVAVYPRDISSSLEMSLLMAEAPLMIDNDGDLPMLEERVDMIAEDFLL